MPIPDYQKIMLPFLGIMSDGQEHQQRDIIQQIADHFSLPPEERDQLFLNGRQTVLSNRVGWARTYLKRAGLIESPQRGTHRITEHGRQALAQKPTTINIDFLMQYPEFRDFVGKEQTIDPALLSPPVEKRTPQEIMAAAYSEMNNALASDLIEKIQQQPPGFFERLVLDLLLAMNYGGSRDDAVQVVGKSGGEGIDGIIKQDRLGLLFTQHRAANDAFMPYFQSVAGILKVLGFAPVPDILVGAGLQEFGQAKKNPAMVSDALEYGRKLRG